MFKHFCTKNLNKRGFTLAEVLITLGIIGIIAAMTIPTLMQAYKEKQTVSQLIATQSIMSRALKLAEEEYGEVEGWDANKFDGASATIVADRLKPFLKLSVDCGLQDPNGKCFENKMTKLLNGKNYENWSVDNRMYKFKLMNGTTIGLVTYSDRITPIVFLVDINGKNFPNVMGKDLFLFRYENNSFRPSGAPDGKSYFSYTKDCFGKNSTGYGCAFWVVHNKNMKYLHQD